MHEAVHAAVCEAVYEAYHRLTCCCVGCSLGQEYEDAAVALLRRRAALLWRLRRHISSQLYVPTVAVPVACVLAS